MLECFGRFATIATLVSKKQQQRDLTWLVAIGFVLVWVFFVHARAYSANDASRMASIESLVQRGTWQIDDSPFTTIDKIQVEDGFVSDKPPLLSFAGATLYWPLHLLGLDLQAQGCTVGCRAVEEVDSADYAYIFLTLVLVALPGAAMLALAYRLAWHNGFPNWLAVALVLMLGLGTAILPFSTVFTNHIPAAAAVVAAFYLLMTARERVSNRRLALAGLLAALAVTLDLSAGVYAVGLLVYVVWRFRRNSVAFIAGGSVPVVIAIALNWWVAGSLLPPQMLTGGYQYEGSSLYGSFSGFSSADNIPNYAFRMLVGDHGALAFYPIVIWYGYATLRSLRDKRVAVRGLSRVALVATGVYILYFVLSTDNFGGLAYSPRWMLNPMPVLALFSFVDVALYRPNPARLAYVGLAAISLFSGVRGAFDPWLPAQPLLQLTVTPRNSAEFVNVALSGYASYEEVDADIRDTMAFDRVLRRWFDATQAVAIPPGDVWWFINEIDTRSS